MPVKTEFTEDGRGVVQTGWGVVTAAEILREMVLQHTDPARPQGHDYVLIDFTQVTAISARPTDIARLVVEQEIVSRTAPNVALAVAATGDVAYGMGRMWQGMAVPLRWENGIFRTRAEAIDWLKARRGPVQLPGEAI